MNIPDLGTINDTFTSRRGIVYVYTISWVKADRCCRWEAIVRCNGRIVAAPSGECPDPFHGQPLSQATEQLKKKIESSLDEDS
jgi:hypothetical protein